MALLRWSSVKSPPRFRLLSTTSLALLVHPPAPPRICHPTRSSPPSRSGLGPLRRPHCRQSAFDHSRSASWTRGRFRLRIVTVSMGQLYCGVWLRPRPRRRSDDVTLRLAPLSSGRCWPRCRSGPLIWPFWKPIWACPPARMRRIWRRKWRRKRRIWRSRRWRKRFRLRRLLHRKFSFRRGLLLRERRIHHRVHEKRRFPRNEDENRPITVREIHCEFGVDLLECQSINQSINQSIILSINQSINQSINLPINKSINESNNQSINQNCTSRRRKLIWCYSTGKGVERLRRAAVRRLFCMRFGVEEEYERQKAGLSLSKKAVEEMDSDNGKFFFLYSEFKIQSVFSLMCSTLLALYFFPDVRLNFLNFVFWTLRSSLPFFFYRFRGGRDEDREEEPDGRGEVGFVFDGDRQSWLLETVCGLSAFWPFMAPSLASFCFLLLPLFHFHTPAVRVHGFVFPAHFYLSRVPGISLGTQISPLPFVIWFSFEELWSARFMAPWKRS